jgi:hypothetical protein
VATVFRTTAERPRAREAFGTVPRAAEVSVHTQANEGERTVGSVSDRVMIFLRTKLTVRSDYWSPEQAVEFFRGTLEIDAEFGFTGIVCHETHRNRGLFNPYVSAYILEKVPEYEYCPLTR